MRRVSLPLTLAAALALAGCAAQQESSAERFQGAERDVAQVVEDLESAGQKGDAEEVCTRILSPELAKSLEAGDSTCEEEIGTALSDSNDYDLDVRDVTVSGTTARAEVRSGDEKATATLEFAREGDEWRATSLAAAG